MDFKGTKECWKAKGFYINTDKGVSIARAFESDIRGTITHEQAFYNAKLMAKSPIMFEYIKNKAINGDQEAINIINEINGNIH